MGFEVILLAGKLVKHGVGVLLLCWRRVLRATLLAGGVGIVLTEIVAAILARRVLPGIPAFIVALALGAALAYCAAVTVLIDEMFQGALDAVRLFEGDVLADARAAELLAEREAGGVLGWLGYRRIPRKPIPLKPEPLFPVEYASAWSETRQAIADTEEFASTAPRPAVGARPVRADRLPRIEWANAEADTRPDAGDDRAAFASTPLPDKLFDMPPLPAKASSKAAPAGDTHGDPDAGMPTVGGQTDHAAPAASTERSVWSRISQALVGTIPQPAEARPHAESNEPMNTTDSLDDETTQPD